MRAWLATNAGLKLVALLLAAFIWFFVRAVASESRTVEGVPLEIRTAPGFTVSYSMPKAVNVTVRGTTEDVRQASRYELFAVLDLQHEEHPGRFQARLEPRDIRHPRRVLVMAVDPTNIVVRLEKATGSAD